MKFQIQKPIIINSNISNSVKKDGKADLIKFDKKENSKTTWKSKNVWKIFKDTVEQDGIK